MRDDCTETQKILELKNEAKGFYTIFVKNIFDEFIPGQFIMLWIPRLDEKPFGISYIENNRVGITFEVKGEFTKRLSKMNKGSLIGLRGMYGNGFPKNSISGKAIIIGGGCGIAPLAPLAETLKNAELIIGARSKEYLLFTDRFRDADYTTDDGTFGKKGFVTDVLEETLNSKKDEISEVYCCGPEVMMAKVMMTCNEYNKKCYLSLERYMKCGFGICGQCMCGDKVVCKEGPVFEAQDLKGNTDFNKYAGVKTGKKVLLKEYTNWRSGK